MSDLEMRALLQCVLDGCLTNRRRSEHLLDLWQGMLIGHLMNRKSYEHSIVRFTNKRSYEHFNYTRLTNRSSPESSRTRCTWLRILAIERHCGKYNNKYISLRMRISMCVANSWLNFLSQNSFRKIMEVLRMNWLDIFWRLRPQHGFPSQGFKNVIKVWQKTEKDKVSEKYRTQISMYDASFSMYLSLCFLGPRPIITLIIGTTIMVNYSFDVSLTNRLSYEHLLYICLTNRPSLEYLGKHYSWFRTPANEHHYGLYEKNQKYSPRVRKLSNDVSGYCIVNIDYKKCKYKIRIKSKVSIIKIKKCIRKLLNINNHEAMYIFCGNQILSVEHLVNSIIDVVVVGDMRFGGAGSVVEEVDRDTNSSCDNIDNVITCSYSNTDGSAQDKLMAIELETAGDRDFMATELNLRSGDTSILTNRIGAWAAIVDGSHYTYKKGKRVDLDGSRKKSGYGTGIVTKDAGAIRMYESLDEPTEKHFEILALEVVLSDKCKEGRIVVYRSPSMKDRDEIEEFYERVDRYIKHMKKSNKFQCITYIGDPNKENNPLAKRREAGVMSVNGLKNLIGSNKTRFKMGIESQPDSCYAWFDPGVVSVSAHVSGKIHSRMDHRLIRVKYVFKGTIPKYREFREFERTIRDDKKSNEQVENMLEQKLNGWYSSYAGLVFHKFDRQKNDIEEYPDDVNINVSDELVDSATNELYDLINEVQLWMSKTIKVKLPNTVHEQSNKQEVKLGQLSALLGEFSAKIRDNPTRIDLREKFIKIEKEKCELINQIAMERLESKMKQLSEKYPKSKMSSKSLFDMRWII